MKRLLVLSFFPAFVPPRSGGEVRLYNFYFAMSRYYQVTLISSGVLNAQQEEIWHTSTFLEIRVPKDAAFIKEWQRLEESAGSGDMSAPCVAACAKSITQIHSAYMKHYIAADVVIHESPFTIDFDIFCGIDKKPRIYNSYNCEYVLYSQMHSDGDVSTIGELVRRIETKAINNSVLVTYCATNDLRAFEQLVGHSIKNSAYIPNGMAHGVSRAKLTVDGIGRVVFIGSAHRPNVEAATYIVEKLANQLPDVIFDVIGDCLPSGSYPTNVVRHGSVDSEQKLLLLGGANIAINPTTSGSGSSLKILDFVSNDIPILSTKNGMRGFEFVPGLHFIEADIESFPAILLQSLADTVRLRSVATAAKTFAMGKYSWQGIAAEYSSLISGLIEEGSRESCGRELILALNDFDPFSAIGGGATRIQGIYTALSASSKVVVLCFSADDTFRVDLVTDGIWRIAVPKTDEHKSAERKYNEKFHVSVDDIIAYTAVMQNPELVAIYDVLRAIAKMVICDHPYMSKLPTSRGDAFIYSSQNFEFGLKKDLLKWHPDVEMLLREVAAAESMCVASSIATVAVTVEDAQALTEGQRAASPVMVVPNGAASPAVPGTTDIESVSAQIGERSVVFLGSAHMPNVDAGKFIVQVLAPACRDVEFHIVGSVCHALGTEFPKNVRLWGVVSDPLKSAILGRCGIAINPMIGGSGSNVKLADFMANGLHVISTEFGVRGYPAAVFPHVTISGVAEFADRVNRSFDRGNGMRSPEEAALRVKRRQVFEEHLSMKTLAAGLAKFLEQIELPKKKLLFVTYRYSFPALGGAESMLERLIRGLSTTGKYKIDIVSPEVSDIQQCGRFGSNYGFDRRARSPVGLSFTRYERFPVSPIRHSERLQLNAQAWLAQIAFERHMYTQKKSLISRNVLAWGWGPPDHDDGGHVVGQWAMMECGVHVHVPGNIRVRGFAPTAIPLRAFDDSDAEMFHRTVSDAFDIDFDVEKGCVSLFSSLTEKWTETDPRPLALYINSIEIDGVRVEALPELPADSQGTDTLGVYQGLYEAARFTRYSRNIRLTDIRGPHCDELEELLARSTKDYDIVVTHNSIFRPAVAAVAAANNANVPVILIPHVHLDDDFYHFPDVHEAAMQADIVMAAPRAACEFYERMGARKVSYLPSGIDLGGVPSSEDISAFRSVYAKEEPFLLVLGRKAAAKGYKASISAVERLAAFRKVRLVLIGPDEDGVPIDASSTTYLGMQPTSVVRGALGSCLGLINMSSSESFGMVLLEAWLAKKPVIVNAGCSAFRDLAIDDVNALVVVPDLLESAIERLLDEPQLCERLGIAGSSLVDEYGWDKVCQSFVDACEELTC